MDKYLFLAYGATISIMTIFALKVVWDYRKSVIYAQKRKK